MYNYTNLSGIFDLPIVDKVKAQLGEFLQSGDKIRKLNLRSESLITQLKTKGDNTNVSKVIGVQSSLPTLMSTFREIENDAKNIASGKIEFSLDFASKATSVLTKMGLVIGGIKKADQMLSRIEGKTGLSSLTIPGLSLPAIPTLAVGLPILIIGGGLAFFFMRRKKK